MQSIQTNDSLLIHRQRNVNVLLLRINKEYRYMPPPYISLNLINFNRRELIKTD